MKDVACIWIMLITFDLYLGWHNDYNLKTDIVDDIAILISKFWCKYISDLDSGVSLNLRSGSQTGRQNSRWWWLWNAYFVRTMMTIVILAIEFRMIILWVWHDAEQWWWLDEYYDTEVNVDDVETFKSSWIITTAMKAARFFTIDSCTDLFKRPITTHKQLMMIIT